MRKGNQIGHLRLAERDERLAERARRPGCCGRSWRGGGRGKPLHRGEATGAERRQVIGIPPVKAEVTEHQVLTVKCGCGRETRAGAPENAPAPVLHLPAI